jgi:hypothetical protein
VNVNGRSHEMAVHTVSCEKNRAAFTGGGVIVNVNAHVNALAHPLLITPGQISNVLSKTGQISIFLGGW